MLNVPIVAAVTQTACMTMTISTVSTVKPTSMAQMMSLWYKNNT
jgi:hypothetical protein